MSAKAKTIFKGREDCSSPLAEQEGNDLWTRSLPVRGWNSQVRQSEPGHKFHLTSVWVEEEEKATRILSLFLFLQIGFFSLPFPWSLHRFFNACRGQFESYFLVLCVIIPLVSLPALKHCRSTDWSRILRRSEKQDSLQSKAPAGKSCCGLCGTTRLLGPALLQNFHVSGKIVFLS